MKNKEQNLNEFKRKTEYKGFHDFKKLDDFIQSSLEKFKLVEPMKELYDATKNDANSIVSHKSTIPDLVIWNKKFNKNECFYNADLKKDNPFPRFQFFLRVKGTKNDKEKKKEKEKNKNNKKLKKKGVFEKNIQKEKIPPKKENEIKNLSQLLNMNNNEKNKNSKMKEIGTNGDIKDSERIIPQNLEYLDDFPKKKEKNTLINDKENDLNNVNQINLGDDDKEKEDNKDNNDFNLGQINDFKTTKVDFFNQKKEEEEKPNLDYQINDNNNLNEINALFKMKDSDENLNNNLIQNQTDDKKQKKNKKKKNSKTNLNPQNNMNNNFMINNQNMFMQGMQNNFYPNQGNRNINFQQQFMSNEYLLNLVYNNINKQGWVILNNEGKIFGKKSSFELFEFLSQNLNNNNFLYIFISDIETGRLFNSKQMYIILSQTLPLIIKIHRQMLINQMNMNNMNNMNMNNMNMNNMNMNNMNMNNMNNINNQMMMQNFLNFYSKTMALYQMFNQMNQINNSMNRINIVQGGSQNNTKKLGRLPRGNGTDNYDPFMGYKGPKMNLLFETPSGHKTNIACPINIKVYDLLCQYISKVGLGPNVIGNGIYFLYNGRRLGKSFYDSQVDQVFTFGEKVVVIDYGNLIGA